MGSFLGSRRIMPASRPSPQSLCYWKLPLRRRLWGDVGLTYDDLAGSEVADAEGLPRVVRFDAEHDALGPA